MKIPMEIFRQRRRRLAKEMRDGAALILSSPPSKRGRDSEYPYRPDSRFLYLSGFAEPESAVVVFAENGKFVRDLIYCRPRDSQSEQWTGRRLGPVAAKNRLQFDDAKPIAKLADDLPELLSQAGNLFYALGANAQFDARILPLIAAKRERTRGFGKGKKILAAVRDPCPLIDEMRIIKDDYEISLMREAARITAEAHRQAMRAAVSAAAENEIEAAIVRVYREANADHAFSPIVAAGANACILHYDSNRRKIRRGDLILIDSGCEFNGYAADVTRTIPSRGKFSSPQRDVMEIVLAAQAAAIAKIKPGARCDSPQKAALRILCEGLRELKLCRGNADAIIRRRDYNRFYMHEIGHWLGMDVHDVGSYNDADGKPRRFAAGMAMTIEPGLYIPAAADIPPPLRGIGVRIEDDILITKSGRENLSAAAPKSPRDIEGWMN